MLGPETHALRISPDRGGVSEDGALHHPALESAEPPSPVPPSPAHSGQAAGAWSPDHAEQFGSDLRSHDTTPLLWVAADGREGVFLIPCHRAPYARQEFGFCALRFVEFLGAQQLVSWCNTPSCLNRTELGPLYSQKDFPTISSEDMLGDTNIICECASELVRQLGGQAAVRVLYRKPPLSATRCTPHTYDGKDYQLVQLGPLLEDFAVLYNRGEKQLCSNAACSNHKSKCSHLDRAAEGVEQSARPHWLPPEQFEAKLAAVFDMQSGVRKLNCLSRKPIPEDMGPADPLGQLCIGKLMCLIDECACF